MARPALATLDDLERLLGDIAEPDQAEARIEQSSELVRAYAGVDWLNDDETAIENVPGAIPGVVVGIVERASANPGGVVSETTGPFSRSFGADAASRIYLTDGDKRIIRHALGSGQSPLGVISTTRGAMETPNVIDCWDGVLVEADDPYALWP